MLGVCSGIKERAELTFPVAGWTLPTAFVRFQNKKQAVEAARTLQRWKPAESKYRVDNTDVTERQLVPLSRSNNIKLEGLYLRKCEIVEQ